MNNEKKEVCSLDQTANSHQHHFTKRTSRSKAIRMKCLDCCAYQPSEVKQCESYDCPLWRYRMGKEERDDLYRQSRRQKDDDQGSDR